MSWEIQKFLTESLIPFNSVIISFQEAAKEAAPWNKIVSKSHSNHPDMF